MAFRLQSFVSAGGFPVLHSQGPSDWRDDLVSRNPTLLKDPSGGAAGRPEVGDGWADVVARALHRIAAISNAGVDFRILAIKEKFGTLRIYTSVLRNSVATNAIEEIVALAEARSECTCEICGAEGVLYERGFELATRCEAHAVGSPVEVRPGWENIHIKRHLKPGRSRIVWCRRYLRESDKFVDILPLALGINE